MHHHHRHHHHHHGHHDEKLSQELNDLISRAPVSPEVQYANGNEVWEALQRGNELFTSGHYGGYILNLAHGIQAERKTQLAGGQTPHAIIVSCSDSRVPPELVFNQGLGHIFVVRVAGNVIDSIALGSIEYAVEHLHSQLIVVLGHQKCGAVKAAVDTHGTEAAPAGESSIPSILAKIYPAVATAKGANAADLLDASVQQNAKNTVAEILEKSHIVAEHVKEGKVVIHAAEYSLDTCKVTQLD